MVRGVSATVHLHLQPSSPRRELPGQCSVFSQFRISVATAIEPLGAGRIRCLSAIQPSPPFMKCITQAGSTLGFK